MPDTRSIFVCLSQVSGSKATPIIRDLSRNTVEIITYLENLIGFSCDEATTR